MLVFVVSYLILLLPHKPVCFLMKYRKKMDPYGRGVGEELGGLEGEESVIRIYYMRGKSIFNKRGEVPCKIIPI